MGQTMDRMKEGYSKIRNEALAHAFAYMNLIEHWGSGIPRIIDKVTAAGLQESEFIGGEVDLHINIYRGQVDTNNAMINANGTKNGVIGAEVLFNKEQPQIKINSWKLPVWYYIKNSDFRSELAENKAPHSYDEIKIDVDQYEQILEMIFEENANILSSLEASNRSNLNRMIRIFDYFRYGPNKKAP